MKTSYISHFLLLELKLFHVIGACKGTSLKFVFVFFSLPLSPPFIINHSETVNCRNSLVVSTFVGDFGQELSCKCAVFRMGVAATLPKLSEWTLLGMYQ